MENGIDYDLLYVSDFVLLVVVGFYDELNVGFPHVSIERTMPVVPLSVSFLVYHYGLPPLPS